MVECFGEMVADLEGWTWEGEWVSALTLGVN
jgi:hypothetical protein